MRRLTIRTKAILWYTTLILLLTGLLLVLTVAIGRTFLHHSLYERVKEFVEENIEGLQYEDGRYIIDESYIDRENGMCCLAYDGDGTLLAGKLPTNISLGYDFVDGQFLEFYARQRTYYLYDRQVMFEGGGVIRLRGLIYDRESSYVIASCIRAVLLILPFVVLLSVLGGQILLKHAFRPLEEAIRTANEISAGEDLSKRIPVGSERDEIAALARTFNNMLERLEQNFELEKQYISNVSHELRTPVTVILSQCEVALESKTITEEERQVLGRIDRQARKISESIAQFLMFGRLERGMEKLELEPVDFSALVRHVCQDYRLLPDVVPKIEESVQDEIYLPLNREMMTRLVGNLLDNACKYGRDGGKVCVSMGRKDGFIVLTVTDFGIGIEPQEQEKIWHRFYQAPEAKGMAGSRGIGLGLYMVYEIAKLHSGEISVESTSGCGSTFTLKLKDDSF